MAKKTNDTAMLKQDDWIIHHVLTQGSHTHGIYDTYGKPDLECVLSIVPEAIQEIMWTIFHLMENEEIVLNKPYFEIATLPILFIKSPDRANTLRIILPDESGELDMDKLKSPYKEQYKKIADLENEI